VALKVIKLGMDTRSVIARFEAERQALAMMDHPNIAKVLDAGATETGRPYYVMELVRGVKITEYCDEVKLPTRARLELFMRVSRAGMIPGCRVTSTLWTPTPGRPTKPCASK
jgi:serine/threonine protein kinase